MIDDEYKIRKIFLNLIAAEGHAATEAATAADAYEILLREKMDLVLLDINMPEMDGSLIHYLLEAFGFAAKIIVCSVRPVSEQKEIIRGAVDYYDKAEGIEALRVKMERALKD